jgi:hypothetical protein
MLRLISWKTICCSRRVASILPHVHSPLYPVYVDGPVQADTTRGTEALVIANDTIIGRDKMSMQWYGVACGGDECRASAGEQSFTSSSVCLRLVPRNRM